MRTFRPARINLFSQAAAGQIQPAEANFTTSPSAQPVVGASHEGIHAVQGAKIYDPPPVPQPHVPKASAIAHFAAKKLIRN